MDRAGKAHRVDKGYHPHSDRPPLRHVSARSQRRPDNERSAAANTRPSRLPCTTDRHPQAHPQDGARAKMPASIDVITNGRWHLCAGAILRVGLWMSVRRARQATGASICCCAAFIVGPSLRASRYVTKWGPITMGMIAFVHPMSFSRSVHIVEPLVGVLPRTRGLRCYVCRRLAALPWCVWCFLLLWCC